MYLNTSMRLGLPFPLWSLLLPLLRTGVVDFVGNGSFALAPTITLIFRDRAYIFNSHELRNQDDELPVGISLCSIERLPDNVKTVKLSTLSVLKSLPTVKDVVMSWPLVKKNGAELEYKGLRKLGISKPAKAGQTRYFYIPGQKGVRELPSPKSNPEAYPIASCFQRIIEDGYIGRYVEREKELTMNLYGLPTLLARALMIDGMSIGCFPTEDGRRVIYYYISKPVINELNRILCKSIVYEQSD